MRAIIIAAGKGARMGPLTRDLPKCLLSVRGRTLLDRQIDSYRRNDVEDISVIRGFQSEKINVPGVRYFLNHDFGHNNILHSLMCARSVMSDAFVASYSDILFDDKVLSSLLQCPDDIAIVVDRDWRAGYIGRTEHPVAEAEKVVVDSDHMVRTIGKAIDPPSVSGEFVGMLKCTRAGALRFQEYFDQAASEYDPEAPFVRAASFRKAYVTDLLQYMVDDDVDVKSVTIRGGWQEIDVQDDLIRADNRPDQEGRQE